MVNWILKAGWSQKFLEGGPWHRFSHQPIGSPFTKARKVAACNFSGCRFVARFDSRRSLVLQAVKQNGGALAYADPSLQEDRGADGVAEVVAASQIQ